MGKRLSHETNIPAAELKLRQIFPLLPLKKMSQTVKFSTDAQTLKLSLSNSLATVHYFRSFVLMNHNAQNGKMNE